MINGAHTLVIPLIAPLCMCWPFEEAVVWQESRVKHFGCKCWLYALREYKKWVLGQTTTFLPLITNPIIFLSIIYITLIYLLKDALV